MTHDASPGDDSFIWVTRGRTWGFRFLRRGELADALSVYEHAFSEIGDLSEAWRLVDDKVALRFRDPDGRRDAADRVIPHDFVLLGSLAEGVTSIEEGRQRIWHLVADEFRQVWDQVDPPVEDAEAHPT